MGLTTFEKPHKYSSLNLGRLPQIVGSMYVSKHFDQESKTMTEEMVDDLK